MQLTFVYNGNPYEGVPKIALVVDYPKLRTTELDSKTVAQIRVDLYRLMSSISDEAKENPNEAALGIFRLVRDTYQSIVLVAVVFSVEDITGDTVVSFTAKDLNL